MLNFDYPENENKTVIDHVNCKKESCIDCNICKTILNNIDDKILIDSMDFIPEIIEQK